MKKYILILLLVLSCVSLWATDAQRTYKGVVKCDNKGVGNVIVTDGKSFTRTKANGSYVLKTDNKQSYIYYTLPSGYESPIERGVPVFYKPISNKSLSYDFELKRSKLTQQKHAFILWADPQVIDPEEFKLLDKVVDDTNLTIAEYTTIPVHAINCGDIVFDRLNLFDPYKDLISKIKVPFYHVIGNHDLDYSNQTSETSTKSYESKFGPAYYSFNKGKVHYIVLNDVFYYGHSYHYMGYMNQQQLDWLSQDLSYVPKGSTVIVSLHIPTKYLDVNMRPGLEKLQKNSLVNNTYFYNKLKGYNVHILAGHSHTQWNTIVADSILEHTHVAACAAWWQGEIGLDGTPKGYTVYEVDGDNLTWYFKGVGLSKDHQFKLYPIGADIDNPEAFVVNVYNYDPQWKVIWYENGVAKGAMEQYWGVDPLSRELYQPGKNKKYSWLSFDSTNHIFKATPNNKNATIKVEVTDRFGNKWVETLN